MDLLHITEEQLKVADEANGNDARIHNLHAENFATKDLTENDAKDDLIVDSVTSESTPKTSAGQANSANGTTQSDLLDDSPVSISARLGQLRFHISGKFRVLQISDIQAGPKVVVDTVRLISAACDAARPDIVIFTGNQIAGFDSAYASTHIKRSWIPRKKVPTEADIEHAKNVMRSSIKQFISPIVERKIPFAVTFGNHDFQCGLSLEQMTDIYREFPGCVNPDMATLTQASSSEVDNDAVDLVGTSELLPHQRIISTHEPGTFALEVRDGIPGESDRLILGLTVVNSGDYDQEGGYASPSRIALDFIPQVAKNLKTRCMLFQHMPIRKFYELLKPVPATTANAIQGYRDFESISYVINEELTQPGSYLGEGISCPDGENEEFDLLKDNGYFALSAGHDHRNGFVGEVDGILLAASPTCGFSTYGPAPKKRAVRLFEFDIRHPFNPRTQLLEFGDLVGKPSSSKAYALATTYMPNNSGEAMNLLRKPKIFASIVAAVAGVVASVLMGWRKK